MKQTFRLLSIALLTTLPLAMSAQTSVANRGGISQEMLRRFQHENPTTGAQKALQNAIVANPINKLTTNADNRFMYDRHFSHRVETKGITDQESSGRCWLFTGLNVYRAKVIKKHGLNDFRFSHVYPFFYDQLEKANLFLQGIIDTADRPMDDKMVEWLFKNPLSDGGQYTGISDILTKYGVVPAEVMPETYSSNNTGQMARVIKLRIKEEGLRLREAVAAGKSTADITEMKTKALSDVYRILVLCLGTPPQSFEYTLRDASGKAISTKTYTPKSFFDEFIGDDLTGNYVMLMNDPSRPFDTLYEIDYDRHAYDGRNWLYVNLPIEEIKQMAIASIKGNDAMYFSCDVGQSLDSKNGTLDVTNFDLNELFGLNLNMDKAERIRTFSSASTHAMTLMAVDLDAKGQPKKWMVENSWGATSGFEGHLVMTDKWFDEYMYRVVVHQKYITDKVKRILKTKPTKLPAWDPMFENDR